MRDETLTVIIDIKRLFKICEDYLPLITEKDYLEVIKYKLSKECGYEVEEFDHRCVGRFTHELLRAIKNAGGFYLRLPPGVITIEEIKTTKGTARIVCSGRGGVFSADGAVRGKSAEVRSHLRVEESRVRSSKRLDFILDRCLAGNEDTVQNVLGL